MSPRVKPTEPAPIIATLMAIVDLKVTGGANSATGETSWSVLFFAFLCYQHTGNRIAFIFAAADNPARREAI